MTSGLCGSILIVFVAILVSPSASWPSAREVAVEWCSSDHYFDVDRKECYRYTNCSSKCKRIARKGNATADNECGGCSETYYYSSIDEKCYCCYVRRKNGDASYQAQNDSNCPSVDVTMGQLECLFKRRCSAPFNFEMKLVDVTQMTERPTTASTTASPTTLRPIRTLAATTPHYGTRDTISDGTTVSPITTRSPESTKSYPKWIVILVICLAGVVLVILAMLVYFAVRACRRKNGKELLELLFTGAGLKHEVTDILGGKQIIYIEKSPKQPVEQKEEITELSVLVDQSRSDDVNVVSNPIPDSHDDQDSNDQDSNGENVVANCHNDLSETLRTVCEEIRKKKDVAVAYVFDGSCLYISKEKCERWSDYFECARKEYELEQNVYKFQSGKNDCISLLPFSLLKRLAKILDVRRPLSNDYRLLADHFRLPREDIDHLAVELYEKPHGSPFLRLVGELVRRKVVVGKLIEPLQEIGHDELAKEVEEHADAVAEYWESVEKDWRDYCKQLLERRPGLKSDKRDLLVHSQSSFASLQMIAKVMDNQEQTDSESWIKWINRFGLAPVDAENLHLERKAFWSSLEQTKIPPSLTVSPTFSFVKKVLKCDPESTFMDIAKLLPKKVARYLLDSTTEHSPNAMS